MSVRIKHRYTILKGDVRRRMISFRRSDAGMDGTLLCHPFLRREGNKSIRCNNGPVDTTDKSGCPPSVSQNGGIYCLSLTTRSCSANPLRRKRPPSQSVGMAVAISAMVIGIPHSGGVFLLARHPDMAWRLVVV